jgi:hypothetical protein
MHIYLFEIKLICAPKMQMVSSAATRSRALGTGVRTALTGCCTADDTLNTRVTAQSHQKSTYGVNIRVIKHQSSL